MIDDRCIPVRHTPAFVSPPPLCIQEGGGGDHKQDPGRGISYYDLKHEVICEDGNR